MCRFLLNPRALCQQTEVAEHMAHLLPLPAQYHVQYYCNYILITNTALDDLTATYSAAMCNVETYPKSSFSQLLSFQMHL